jgi:hypothetical protein
MLSSPKSTRTIARPHLSQAVDSASSLNRAPKLPYINYATQRPDFAARARGRCWALLDRHPLIEFPVAIGGTADIDGAAASADRDAHDPKLINAKRETVGTLARFPGCIPLWNAIKGQRAKQPHAMAIKNGSPFGLAGLWENWKHQRPVSGSGRLPLLQAKPRVGG